MNVDLPEQIPLIPLNGIILLPGCIIDLKILEQRYIQLVEDVLKDKKLIGIIQPREYNPKKLYEVGCLGKINYSRNLHEGGYLIRLEGYLRFRLIREFFSDRSYRKAYIDSLPFQMDKEFKPVKLDKKSLYEAFKEYLKNRNENINWERLSIIPTYRLVNILSMNLELPPSEKQALLESTNVKTRCEDLKTLLKMASFFDGSNKLSISNIN